ncbi:MAG: hypothetical protein P9L99_19240 [Candidatus Lernaella stagnicola]|nr:hypothetical protein [Candidatus Lernaella stagnicola]
MQNKLILVALLALLLVVFACGGGDSGTLNDSLDDPDAGADDDNGGSPSPGDDDDDTSGDDDTGGDDDDDDTPFEGDLTELFIKPEFTAEPVGFEIGYGANGRDTAGNDVNNVPVDWSIADTAIASINTDGVATTLSNGKTLVQASWYNVGNGETITASANLWVTGDVFVVGQGGRIALLDVGNDTETANYLGTTLDGELQSMTIMYDSYGAIVSLAEQGYVSLFDLDPDDVKEVSNVTLLPAHIGVEAIENNDNLYIVENTNHDLSIFRPLEDNWENSYMAGMILLNDLSYPTDVGVNDVFLLALGSNTEPGSGVYNEGYLYFIDGSGNTMNAIVGRRSVEWPNPIKVAGAQDYAIVLSSGDDAGSGSRLDFYEVANHEGFVNMDGKMATLAALSTGQVWIGDGEAPNVYAYSIDGGDWVVSQDDPIVLPDGDRVVAMQPCFTRNEIWVATDDGTVYGISAVDLTVEYTFDLTGFNIVDIEIW